MVTRAALPFLRSDDGVTMIEAAISITLLLILTLGFVDFGYAYWQWNAATKAVQAGARIAAVSPPVDNAIKNAAPTTTPGAAITPGAYDTTCSGATSSCTFGTFVAANFTRILEGHALRPGMRDFFPRIQAANVEIRYTATGLGYQTRFGGAVPTITVSLTGLNYQFFFLAGLMGFGNVTMPSMLSTITGEDLDDGTGS